MKVSTTYIEESLGARGCSNPHGGKNPSTQNAFCEGPTLTSGDQMRRLAAGVIPNVVLVRRSLSERSISSLSQLFWTMPTPHFRSALSSRQLNRVDAFGRLDAKEHSPLRGGRDGSLEDKSVLPFESQIRLHRRR